MGLFAYAHEGEAAESIGVAAMPIRIVLVVVDLNDLLVVHERYCSGALVFQPVFVQGQIRVIVGFCLIERVAQGGTSYRDSA